MALLWCIMHCGWKERKAWSVQFTAWTVANFLAVVLHWAFLTEQRSSDHPCLADTGMTKKRLLGWEGLAVIAEAAEQACLYFISQSYKLLSVWLQLRPNFLRILVKRVLEILQHFCFPGIILSKCAAENGVPELVLEPAEVQVIDWVLYSKGLSFMPHRILNGTCIYKNEGLKQPRPSASHFSVEEKHFGQTACGRKKKFHHGRNEKLSCLLMFKEWKLFMVFRVIHGPALQTQDIFSWHQKLR